MTERRRELIESPESASERTLSIGDCGVGAALSLTQTTALTSAYHEHQKVLALTKPGYVPTDEGIKFFDNYRAILDDIRALGPENSRVAVRMDIGMFDIFRDGPGQLNQDAVDKYREVLTYARDIGLEFVITLHHFDDPTWWKDFGGWYNRSEATKHYLEFIETVFDKLGDILPRNTQFISINEIKNYAVNVGYGTFAPNRILDAGVLVELPYENGYRLHTGKLQAERIADALKVQRNMIYASRAAEKLVDKYNAEHNTEYRIAPSHQIVPLRPNSTEGLLGRLDAFAATTGNRLKNGLDLFDGEPGKSGIVYLQHYFSHVVQFNPRLRLQSAIVNDEGELTSDQVFYIQTVPDNNDDMQQVIGWPYNNYARGFAQSIDMVADNFPDRTIVISEVGYSGARNAKSNSEDNRARVVHMLDTFTVLAYELGRGRKIDKILFWTGHDNNELGADYKFGLRKVTRVEPTFESEPRPTYKLAQQIVADRGINLVNLTTWFDKEMEQGDFAPEDITFIKDHFNTTLAEFFPGMQI